jgi:hypothetical protein
MSDGYPEMAKSREYWDAKRSTVRIPASADEAALMVLLGMNYLKEHAPERLTADMSKASP